MPSREKRCSGQRKFVGQMPDKKLITKIITKCCSFLFKERKKELRISVPQLLCTGECHEDGIEQGAKMLEEG